MPMEKVEAWGRLTRNDEEVRRPRFRSELAREVQQADRILPIGLGRSYGDVGLAHGHTHLAMTGLDRVIAFDRHTGILRAEAGMSLSDILKFCVPHGYFLPTTPGSRFVTLGGAVANDVHGKNHHQAATFGSHVRALGLMRSDGEELTLSVTEHPDLFRATIGGLGLTGVILWAEIALVPVTSAFLEQETIPFSGLDEFMAIADESEERFEHTVAWVDCLASGADLGRGLFFRANWATDGRFEAHRDARLLRLPLDVPSGLVDGWSMRAFNAIYRGLNARGPSVQHVHYAPYFYPLDAIGQWNRAYGSKGFYQYQSVTPRGCGIDPVREMLEVISSAGQGSFLAVLKTFGPKSSPGMLSFPMEGLTLALDFPNKGARTTGLFERLDAIVAKAGGRLYPAKDARMPQWLFDQGYPQKDSFLAHRDPGITSDFAERVFR